MNEQEKFDDLLRSKLSERDFPFDETNWDKAEVAIERSEKRRRIGIVAVIFLAGLLVGIGIMYPFVHTTSKTELASTKPDNNSVAVNNSNIIANKNTSSSKEEQTNSSISTIQTNAAVNLGTTAPQVQAQSTIPAQNNTATASQTQQIAVNTSGSNSEATDIVTPTKKAKHKKHKNTSDTGAIAFDYVRPSTEKKNKKGQKHANSSNPYTTKNNSPTASNNTIAAQNNTSINSTDNNSNIANNNKTTTTDNSNSSVQQNTKQDSSKPVLAVKDSTKKDSSVNNSTVQSNPQEPQPITKYSHTLVSIDAGTNYSSGWMKAGATQGNGFNPVLGFSATHYFSTKISALIGLQYNSLSNINTLYSANSNQYSFGAESGVTSVTIKTLYYIALPLKVQYNINPNNIISAGVQVCYLVNSNSNVVSYTQNYFGTSGYTSAYKTGYTDGINPWDAQVTLAYRRKINRFSITAEGYYGLMDIENNSFFNNNVFERNSGLRLLLSYDIIK